MAAQILIEDRVPRDDTDDRTVLWISINTIGGLDFVSKQLTCSVFTVTYTLYYIRGSAKS